MKKIILSAAVAAMALSTSAFAADKGIDVVTTGQAVVYYQTNDAGDNSMFGSDNSSANVGLQLNLDADLKNGFTFGSQLSYLGTAGLEKNLVSGTRQGVTSNGGSTTDELALTKIFVAKTVGNTTVKIGRQELPKSLSPFAYSEGWNVFKNTFDAVLAVNSDIPDTLIVGAYVSGGTGMDLTTTGDLGVVADNGIGKIPVAGAAYMLTVQNKSIPMTTITASYYDLDDIDTIGLDAAALWLDAKVASKDLPLGLKIGLQGGMISPDDSGTSVAGQTDDTIAMGAKASIKAMDALTLCAAFTTVDGTDDKVNVAVKNTGTGIKSPLYTQMVANQNAISLDGDTVMLKAAYNTGDYGTIIAQGTMTSAGKSNLNGENDFRDLELLYKVKAGGVQYLAAFLNTEVDGADAVNTVRLWARLNF